MTDYFTSDHFKLLNQWKGKRRDESNPEQNRAYDELKKAYKVTEAWAEAVKARLFPAGVVRVRKRPTSQANAFLGYNWARIYPSAESPEQLAYTVGIDASGGFVVKIDTVGLNDSEPDRQAYLSLRGNFDNSSSIVAMLPAAEGLGKSLEELADWSAEAIRGFDLRYEDVAKQLKLIAPLSDEDLLKHFDGKPAFKTFRASWSLQEKAVFCRLARAVHSVGLDWWHIGKDIQVRFGRKNPGSEQAFRVLGIVLGIAPRKIILKYALGAVPKLHLEPLTDDLVARIEAALGSATDSLKGLALLDTDRRGLWPDQLRDDPADLDDDSDEMPPSATAEQPFNRIYYGPPGTGKTYEVSKLLRRSYEQATASVSAEQWRNQFIAGTVAARKWWEGVVMALYDLGESASVGELLDHPFIQSIISTKGRKENVRQTIWATLLERTVDESTTVKAQHRFTPQVFDKDTNSVWRLAGDWKEACADLIALVDAYRAGSQSSEVIRRYTFVTFHQSYGYEEFVEGLRPILESDGDSSEIQYEVRPGAFKELCRRARQEPHQRFAMVIDEINRGNISKIFGELITLIEPDKREGEENQLSLVLPYSGEEFSVPSNIDLIGTMNTADRSLALLDTALRRRFEFVPVVPDARDEAGAPLHGVRVRMSDQIINVPRLLASINQRIEALYDRDHCIGHAYFTSLRDVPDGDERAVALSELFKNRVLPLLEEYFFEDWQKIRLVLADNQKESDAQFVIQSEDLEQGLTRLFGTDHGLDIYDTKRRYGIQDAAFSNANAYIGIYERSPA